MWLLQAYTVKINLLFEEHKDKTFEVKEAAMKKEEVISSNLSIDSIVSRPVYTLFTRDSYIIFSLYI